MRVLAAVIAMLTVVCNPCVAEQTAQQQVVFVCEHGNVKSLMAASYFNQLAEQRHLPFRAISRGSAPDSNTVPARIVAGLRADGVDVSSFRPAALDATDVASAARVVAISTEIPATLRSGGLPVEHWNDVPPASSDYAAARAALKARVADLIRRLQLASGSSPPDRGARFPPG